MSTRLDTWLMDGPHHAALRDGTVEVAGAELAHSDVSPYTEAFKAMARELAFDVCELSLGTYLTARERGAAFTALPVLPVTGFYGWRIERNVEAVSAPGDLAGQRVGIRNLTVTPGIWARGTLRRDYGLDLDSITWVCADPEHLPAAADIYGPNVVPAETFEDLFPRLVSGDLVAGLPGSNLSGTQDPKVAPLFPDALDLQRQYYRTTGVIQPFTAIVVKDSVLDDPQMAQALVDAFAAAKACHPDPPAEVTAVTGGDGLGYGFSASERALDELLDVCAVLGVLRRRYTVGELFLELEPAGQ